MLQSGQVWADIGSSERLRPLGPCLSAGRVFVGGRTPITIGGNTPSSRQQVDETTPPADVKNNKENNEYYKNISK